MSVQVSFAKLSDETWGVRVYPAARGLEGQTVDVRKKDGSTTTVTLGALDMLSGGTTYYRTQTPRRSALDHSRTVLVTEPGVYETSDGVVYVVKPNQAKSRLYAKRLVEIDAERATEAGDRVQIEFEYESGAIYKLAPEMKMPLERAKALTIRYGRCIVCNTPLKAAESVERGIGPVCIKSFGLVAA